MEELFVSYKLAVELKELGFDEPCLGFWINDDEALIIEESKKSISEHTSQAPTYQQAIDWFQEEYDIYIGRTGYNDRKTPKRWVYHVDDYYVQDQSFDGAIKYAIELIKNKK